MLHRETTPIDRSRLQAWTNMLTPSVALATTSLYRLIQSASVHTSYSCQSGGKWTVAYQEPLAEFSFLEHTRSPEPRQMQTYPGPWPYLRNTVSCPVMHVCMHAYVDGCMDACMDAWMHGWMCWSVQCKRTNIHACIDRYIHRHLLHKHIHRYMHR